MKSLKKIALLMVAILALNACNNDFDEFQVKSGIDQKASKKDLIIKNKDKGDQAGSLDVIIE